MTFAFLARLATSKVILVFQIIVKITFQFVPIVGKYYLFHEFYVSVDIHGIEKGISTCYLMNWVREDIL